MSVGDKHFEKKDIQTRLKHFLLKEYLSNWGTVFGNASLSKKISKVHFIDGFAGKGKFDDGQDGSPMIAMDLLFSIQTAFQQNYNTSIRFNIHTVELNEHYHNQLQQIVHNSNFSTQIKNYLGEFEKVVPKLLRSTFGNPALYFIDPFGYKGVNMTDISSILSQPSHEVLINVMSYSLVRNYSIKENENSLKKFFGLSNLPESIPSYLKEMNNFSDTDIQVFDDKIMRLEDSIIELYKKQLKDQIPQAVYTLSKRIYSKLNPWVYFHLVFATKNLKGLVAMKDAMVKFEQQREFEEEQYLNENDHHGEHVFYNDLFADYTSMQTYNYRVFVKDFVRKFKSSGVISFKEMLEFFLQESPLPFKDKEKTCSIYIFIKKLTSENKSFFICSSSAFSNLNKADEIKISYNLPGNFIERIENTKEQTVTQLELF